MVAPCRPTTSSSAPAPWAWASPTRSSTTPTPASSLVDRRHGVGGHWLEAYPFVRLHQSSCFYGVASTLLGGGELQTSGPEAGLQERASQPEIVAYYARVLDRLVRTGRVEFFPNSDFDGHRTVTSRISGERFEVPETCRIVNAHYLAPDHPGRGRRRPSPSSDGARVVAGQRPRPAGGRAEPVRHRRVGQDRDRRDRLAARPGRRPGRDLLGTPSRPVDAQPGPRCSPTRRPSSGWPPTSCRASRRRPRSTRRSCAWRRPG